MYAGHHLQHDLMLNRPLSKPRHIAQRRGRGGGGAKDFTAEETLKESWAELT